MGSAAVGTSSTVWSGAAAARAPSAGLSRGHLFAGLLVVGLANAGIDRVLSSVFSRGIVDSVVNTFDVSAIVWAAAWAGVSLALPDGRHPVRRADWIASAVAAILFLAPFTAFSWVGVAGLALYVIATSHRASPLARGAWIYLAITVSLFWSPKLFEAFSPTVLAADARLVSWITGTERIGNTVRIAGSDAFLWVAPGCSSVANMSLAFLCWMTFGKVSGRPLGPRDAAWCAAAAAAVVALNVLRIAIIALRPGLYETVHGPLGTVVAGYLTLFVIAGVCVAWKRDEIRSRL